MADRSNVAGADGADPTDDQWVTVTTQVGDREVQRKIRKSTQAAMAETVDNIKRRRARRKLFGMLRSVTHL